ncbi:unnamed protein product [Brassicogethes aeneus]|uniref:Glycerol kinase 5 n=1 Tax=Brassicogethes aeneus TaxID=1431903 RepID=A0A9P0AY33_BRAAE|nr:unnamed protein product [Brassicogethes aeneus]
MAGDSRGYVAALDIGTTKIKCKILNISLEAVGSAYKNVTLHYPKPGYVEISPDELWRDVISVIKDAMSAGNINIFDVKSLGISVQRASFITWSKSSGKPFHDFITWKDLRTKNFAKVVNKYWSVRILKLGAAIGHFFTRNDRLFAASNLKFVSRDASVRLSWMLSNIKELNEALLKDDVLFGTMDTWLVYKLTNGKKHVTDISNASATCLYDPFLLQWGLMTNLLRIPKSILPEVVANNYNFGEIEKDIFGAPIKIGCIISDQSSSMLGACCFNKNDLKVTLGTGAFLNLNTGNSIQGSKSGLYPLVGWNMDKEIVYLSEVACNDSGSLIEWALQSGFINSVREIPEMINKTTSNDGVYFIAAFSGLGPPVNDDNAGSGFIGIKPTTRKEHMVRAIMESIIFRVALTINLLINETQTDYRRMRIDGGVSNSDFVCQMLADITGLSIERLDMADLSIIGAGYLAGISSGIWKNKRDLKNQISVEQTFYPSTDKINNEQCKNEMNKWLRAAQRFKAWHTE